MNELAEYHVLQTMYKAHNTFDQGGGESSWGLEECEMLKEPIFKIKLMEPCVTVKGISLWNNLNKETKEAKSNLVFKNIKSRSKENIE